jgi:hypothetical protein
MHLGYAANEMARRGVQSDRMDALKEVMERNAIRFEMRQIDGKLIDSERAAGRQAEPDHIAPHAPEAFRGREESRAMDGAARRVSRTASPI